METSPPTRFVCFGELLLRLGAPGHETLLQSPMMDVHVGGAEANVAVALARMGHMTSLVSRVPDNPLGEAAVAKVRGLGVETTDVCIGDGRMGLYFLTRGAMHRPSQVIYDRKDSSFSMADPASYDWTCILRGAHWLHLSGITPALGSTTATSALEAARHARNTGVLVSIDGNYRPQLWKQWKGNAQLVLKELFALADILFVDHRDLALVLEDELPQRLDGKAQARLTADAAFSAFPNLRWIACTQREVLASNHHKLAASILTRDGEGFAPAVELTGIVDRVGSGDAFAAGILHGLTEGWPLRKVARFGLASGCLKHSWPGDFTYSDRSQIESLMQGAPMDISR